jgi:cell division protein FtsB
MKQDFITNPDNAVQLVRELSRQGNELEDRVQELEAENADLKRELLRVGEKY